MLFVSWEELSLILLIFVASAMTQGIMGFGYGIVAMTMLPLLMGLKDAVTLLSILNAAMMLLSLYWQKKAFKWKDARHLMIGAFIGIPIGGVMIHYLNEDLLLGILGATMIYVGINHFLTRHRKAQKALKIWELPIGIFSGVLAAGFNMGGPPIVAYVFSRDWTVEYAKAILASVFVTTSLSRLFIVGLTGEDLPKILWLSAAVVIPSAIVLRIGIGVGRRIPHEFLRPTIFVYLTIVGGYYLFLH